MCYPIIYSVFASRPIPSSTSPIKGRQCRPHYGTMVVQMECENPQLGLSHSQFSSVAQSCRTLCNPMNRSTPGLPVHHQLPEFTQTHVHQVSDAIQPSHPLSSPSPPAPNPIVGTCKWTDSDKRPPALNSVILALQESTCEQEKHWKSFIKLTLVDGLKVIR